MKMILLILSFVTALLSADAVKDNVKDYLEEQNKKTNKVVAYVDGIAIKQRHVDEAVTSKLQKTFFHKSISKEKREEYNKEALEDLINKELLYAYARREGVVISKERVEEIKQTIMKRFKSKEEFEKKLELSNLTEAELERDISVKETINILYAKQIEVNLTENDLLIYYNENKHKYLRPEAKKIQIITVSINPSIENSLKKSQEKIDEAYSKILKGEDFETIAGKYSDDMSRIKGGNLGYVHKGTFEYVDRNAHSLDNGEISQIIKEDTSFYIIKVLDTKPQLQIAFDKVKKKLQVDLKKKREKSNLLFILESQKKLTKVEIL